MEFTQSVHNQKLNELAKSVNLALKNKHFRSLIKNEAQLQLDGDFDVLLKHIINRQIKNDSYNKYNAENDLTVKVLLNTCFSDSYKERFKSTTSFIDDLIVEFPDLQISVPVHNENWNTDDFIPLVAFIPEEFKDNKVKSIPAYNNNAEIIAIDAVNEPTEPVVVISHNERIVIEPPSDTPPAKPYNLRGVETESGIRLNWDMPPSANYNNITGYRIYRKSSNNQSYQVVGIVNGVYNRSYDDNLGENDANKVFSYYVVSYYNTSISQPSNYITITAPSRPSGVISFEAEQYALKEVELRWENNVNQYISYTEIRKREINSGYSVLKQFSPNVHNYIDREIVPGRRYIYEITQHTGTGISNPKYDFIYAPHRDISINSPVYIKGMLIDDLKGVESWVRGRPEFMVTIANVDANKEAYIIQNKLEYKFEKRQRLQYFYGSKVMDWQPGFWYDMLTFSVIEFDRGNVEFTLSVGYNQKNLDSTSFTARGGVNLSYTVPKNQNCGTYYLSYYDLPDQWLNFPAYGFSMLIGRDDN